MPIAVDDIANAFRQAGVKSGDVLMLHSDAIVVAQLPPLPVPQRLDMLIGAIEEVLGPEGTLVMPTFSYSFTKNEDFDVEETPSTVGLITEHFRQLPGVLRSSDPNFSVAVRGRYAKNFSNAAIESAFGADSAFDLLMQYNGWICCLGCDFGRITFVHYLEQAAKVDYRYCKEFAGRIIRHSVTRDAKVQYFVRDLDRNATTDLGRLKKELRQKNMLSEQAVGRVGLIAVQAKDFFECGKSLLMKDSVALIREGADDF